jgi:hypothetical protein
MDAPARKQRRTTSENIDQSCPAFRVVQKGGGLSRFAADFDFPVSTVHSWMVKRNGRGMSGLIPARTRFCEDLERTISYQAWIIHRGKQLEPPVEFVPEDFVETEEAL